MKKVAFVALLMSLSLVAMLSVTVEASPVGAVVFNGTAKLSSGFPCTGACFGTYSGKANGAGRETVGNKPIKCNGCKVTATYSYQEPASPCVQGHPASALGTAKGTIAFYSKPAYAPKFNWTRVGITAVVTLTKPRGVAIAGFIPPGSCNPGSATVAGVAIFG